MTAPAPAPAVRDVYRSTLDARLTLGDAFAAQVLATTAAALRGRDPSTLRVLDAGCSYGATSRALAARCGRVVGIEPDGALYAQALEFAAIPDNLRLERGDLLDWQDDEGFDLIVLDNVYEHIADHRRAISAIARLLKPDGVFYILVPNKLWPIEVHYRLPFLSYLPVAVANVYLRMTGRGTDYTDCSFAPTYWSLRRVLRRNDQLDFWFTLPANLALTQAGNTFVYRLGAALIRRFPILWTISKALLVVGRRRSASANPSR